MSIPSNNQKAVEIELFPDSSKLYIFFGGIAAGVGMLPFEFYKAAKILNQNKIFVRDFSQCWYHKGLASISSDVISTASYLKYEIEKINVEKVYFVGNSMGGFAAILYASLIRKGEVIAFSPQTFISPFLRFVNKDKRWAKQIRKTYACSLFKKKVWDLKPLVKKQDNEQQISIFVSANHILDQKHAAHLSNASNVKVYKQSGAGHGVVKLLKDQGKLPLILSGQWVE